MEKPEEARRPADEKGGWMDGMGWDGDGDGWAMMAVAGHTWGETQAGNWVPPRCAINVGGNPAKKMKKKKKKRIDGR